MKTVAIYARVSTTDKGQDPEMQLRELREYCGRRELKIVGEYVDNGVSGTKDSRPELNHLMGDARKRLFDAVVVWRFDRFARSVSHLLRALEEFQSLGIEFVSYSEAIDTSTPVGKMTLRFSVRWPNSSGHSSLSGFAPACEMHERRARSSDARDPGLTSQRPRRFASKAKRFGRSAVSLAVHLRLFINPCQFQPESALNPDHLPACPGVHKRFDL